MRRIMEEKNVARMQEQINEQINTRNGIADRLVEKWSHKEGLELNKGQLYDLYNNNKSKARNLAIVMENEERHLKSLTETQISNAFISTPQTVVKVIRLGYPNSIRGDVFTEYAMTTTKDTIYKIETTYDRSVRGATAGAVTYESVADRYASEIEEYSITTSATTTFTGTVDVYPLRPYTVTVYLDGAPIGSDNGSGTISGTGISSGVIDYTTGVYTIVFSSALASTNTLVLAYSENSEVSTLYAQQGQFNIQLVGYDFRAHPYPLGFSWSKMAELQMDSGLNQNAEEVLIAAASDELKKSLDFQAINMANGASKWTSAVTFNTDWAGAGADSDKAHCQSVSKALRNASQKTYDALQRGGRATSYLAGSKACTYLTMHDAFKYDDAMPSVGAYKMGVLQNIPVYQVPSSIVAENDILCVYKNNREDANDSALTIASYVPMYRTQTLEHPNFYKESALAFFGDMKLQTKQYITRVTLSNLA